MTAELRDVAVSGVVGNISFDCYEGSHVFFNNGEHDYFSEWNDLTAEQQQKFIEMKKLLSTTMNTVNAEVAAAILN